MKSTEICPFEAGSDDSFHPKRLKELREGYGYSQYHICEYLNCTQQAYSAYELGKRDIPTKVLILLSKHYDVSIDYILGVSNQSKIKI